MEALQLLLVIPFVLFVVSLLLSSKFLLIPLGLIVLVSLALRFYATTQRTWGDDLDGKLPWYGSLKFRILAGLFVYLALFRLAVWQFGWIEHYEDRPGARIVLPEAINDVGLLALVGLGNPISLAILLLTALFVGFLLRVSRPWDGESRGWIGKLHVGCFWILLLFILFSAMNCRTSWYLPYT